MLKYKLSRKRNYIKKIKRRLSVEIQLVNELIYKITRDSNNLFFFNFLRHLNTRIYSPQCFLIAKKIKTPHGTISKRLNVKLTFLIQC